MKKFRSIYLKNAKSNSYLYQKLTRNHYIILFVEKLTEYKIATV